MIGSEFPERGLLDFFSITISAHVSSEVVSSGSNRAMSSAINFRQSFVSRRYCSGVTSLKKATWNRIAINHEMNSCDSWSRHVLTAWWPFKIASIASDWSSRRSLRWNWIGRTGQHNARRGFSISKLCASSTKDGIDTRSMHAGELPNVNLIKILFFY